MDYQSFSEGYQQPANHEVFHDSPELENLLEGPRKWSSFFGSQLTSYLEGYTVDAPEDKKLLANTLNEYYQEYWHFGIAPLAKAADDLLIKSAGKSFEASAEVHYHQMNMALIEMWHELLETGRWHFQRPSRLTEIQTELGIQSAAIIRSRKIAKATINDPESEVVSTYNGQLTELDTAITLLEVAKSNPSLYIIPGPPQYEAGYNNSKRAADFIVIDNEQKAVRGIQSKTRLRPRGSDPEHPNSYAKFDEYERSFITVIDGFTDLGNSEAGPYKPGRGYAPIASPGLIAMDHLQRVDLKYYRRNKQLQFFIPEILRAKSIARELSGNRKSFITQAARQVESKLQQDLYEDLREDVS